jgi:peroxiredoxin
MKLKKCIQPLKFWIVSLLLLQVIMTRAASADSTGTKRSWISPSNPKFAETVRIFYRAQKDMPSVETGSLQVLVHKHLLNPPETIMMEKEKGIWKAAVSIEDTSIKAVYYIFQYRDKGGKTVTDDNDGRYWDFLLYGRNGAPVPGAHQDRALSCTGFGGKKKENLDEALSEVKTEIALYPENYSVRQLYYTILLRKHSYSETVRQQIQEEIDTLLGKKPGDKAVSEFAANAYRMIGKTDLADNVEKSLIKKYPASRQAGEKTFEEILKLQNPEDRIDRLEQFLSDYPDSHLEELALSQLASARIEIGDTIKIIEIGDRLLKKSTTLSGASGLAAIAGVFSEKRMKLDRAVACSQKALDLVQSFDSSSRPPEMTLEEWNDQRQKVEAQYRDILGWACFQNGNTSKALVELKSASQFIRMPSTFYHLAAVYEKTNQPDSALVYYARASLIDDEIGDKAYDRLTAVWEASGQDKNEMDSFIQRQAQWLKQKQQENILSRRLARPAPDFHLEEIKGDRIRLSDQKGNVIVLCFWATWSKGSGLILDMMEKLADSYGDDVLFLTIATDPNESAVRSFSKKNNIIFPVLLNDGTDQKYELQGVPALFVIDAKGTIQYEHKGYQVNLMNTLAIELDGLL